MAQSEQDLTNEILEIINAQASDILDEIVDLVMKIAEDALAIARREHLYCVRTNNLTSSTGFAVCRDGHVINISAFDKGPGHDGGELGMQKGKEYLNLLLDQDQNSSSITLTMVAGMDYAYFVEKMGLDVLKSAEAHIRKEFEQLAREFS